MAGRLSGTRPRGARARALAAAYDALAGGGPLRLDHERALALVRAVVAIVEDDHPFALRPSAWARAVLE